MVSSEVSPCSLSLQAKFHTKNPREKDSKRKKESGSFPEAGSSLSTSATKKPATSNDRRSGGRGGPGAKYRKNTRTPKARPRRISAVDSTDGRMRLHKLMANLGVASRRVCEEMIAAGRVEVNGHVVTRMGVKVALGIDHVAVDGMTLQTKTHLSYVAFNKPRGVVSAMADPEGRPCVGDYLGKYRAQRLFHVGRLDVDTEGLLLLTNDGEMAHRLSHPRHEVPKTYLVQVRGPVAKGVGRRLLDGISLEDGLARVDRFRLVDSTPGKVLVEIVLHSGKNRIVRRMFKELGYPVERLVRVKFGPIDLGDHKPGSVRGLGNQEIGCLLAEVGL